jgi:hypothetical protein
MSLIGGGGSGAGGAGNPVGGSNPAGIGTSINYIGNHVYGYSGTVTLGDGATVTCLDFTSGSSNYIIAKVQAGFTSRSNDDTNFVVKIDGQLVCSSLFNNTFSDSPVTIGAMEIIIPPSSRVQLQAIKIVGTNNDTLQMWLTGRQYA